MRSAQDRLPLEVDSRSDWRLDEQTRAIGRKGLAEARAALAMAAHRAATREAARTADRHHGTAA